MASIEREFRGGLSELTNSRRRDAGASFNLFGFSFLCHFYSSPVTHHYNPPNVTHGRPDVHALFQLWLGLTEVSSWDL